MNILDKIKESDIAFKIDEFKTKEEYYNHLNKFIKQLFSSIDLGEHYQSIEKKNTIHNNILNKTKILFEDIQFYKDLAFKDKKEKEEKDKKYFDNIINKALIESFQCKFCNKNIRVEVKNVDNELTLVLNNKILMQDDKCVESKIYDFHIKAIEQEYVLINNHSPHSLNQILKDNAKLDKLNYNNKVEEIHHLSKLNIATFFTGQDTYYINKNNDGFYIDNFDLHYIIKNNQKYFGYNKEEDKQIAEYVKYFNDKNKIEPLIYNESNTRRIYFVPKKILNENKLKEIEYLDIKMQKGKDYQFNHNNKLNRLFPIFNYLITK